MEMIRSFAAHKLHQHSDSAPRFASYTGPTLYTQKHSRQTPQSSVHLEDILSFTMTFLDDRKLACTNRMNLSQTTVDTGDVVDETA